jgi:hypothetical protein
MVRTILPPIEVLLVAEYVLDTRAYPRARRVRRLLALRQRTISCGAPVDMALQAPLASAANRIRATESLLARAINDFRNKICSITHEE